MVALETNPYFLKGLQEGFPELFMDGDEKGALCVPLSALMVAAGEHSVKANGNDEYIDIDRNMHLSNGFEHMGLPYPCTHTWSSAEYGDVIPPELLILLQGKEIRAGMTVEWDGETRVVSNIEYGHGADVLPGTTIDDPSQIGHLDLVPASVVALDK